MPNADDFARLLQEAALGAAGAATGGASGSGSSKPEPLVFFRSGRSRQQMVRGPGAPSPFKPSWARPQGPAQVKSGVLKPVKDPDDVRPLSQALGEFYSWSDDERAEWGRYLVEIGFIDEEDRSDYGTLLKAWSEVVQEGANFTAAGRKADPWAVARILAGTDNDGGGPGGGQTRAGRERGFTGVRSATSTNTQVDLTDGATAKALVNQTLSKFLGRNASDDEIRAFTATLNDAERANPITAKTTTTDTFADGVQTESKSSTEQSGGLSSAGRAQTLEDRAVNLPEYASYQAAGYYAPLLFQAIGAPV